MLFFIFYFLSNRSTTITMYHELNDCVTIFKFYVACCVFKCLANVHFLQNSLEHLKHLNCAFVGFAQQWNFQCREAVPWLQNSLQPAGHLYDREIDVTNELSSFLAGSGTVWLPSCKLNFWIHGEIPVLDGVVENNTWQNRSKFHNILYNIMVWTNFEWIK